MSDAEVSHLQSQDVKLEDILKSIRGIIDNHNDALKTEVRTAGEHLEEKDDQILELTSVFYPADSALNKDDDKLISEGVRLESLSKINDFSKKVAKNGYSSNSKNENSIDNMAMSIMKPLIKEWVDNNLSKLVEKVISEEIKQLIPKKK